MANQLTTALAMVHQLPSFLRNRARNVALRRAVPFLGTAKLRFHQTEQDVWEVSVRNKRRVQNHLGQIHACVMVLLAETIGVMICTHNMPGDRIPLVKKLDAQFVRRSQGDMRAIVRLDEAQRQHIVDNEKGEMDLQVTVTDESGEEPVLVTVTTAWIPKQRRT